MDSEDCTFESFDWPCRLDRIPIASITNELNDIIVSIVDSPIPKDLLHNSASFILRPIILRLRRDYLGAGLFYALMANRIHFFQECKEDPAWALLWKTRAHVCELVALKMAAEFETDELAQSLVFEFYPLADRDSVDTPLINIPSWLRISSLEMAIKAEAKAFLAHPVISHVVEDLWDGHIVLDAPIHKAHRASLRTGADLKRLLASRRGILSRYSFENTTIIKPSRLRVPKYRQWLKSCNVAVIVGLYIWNLGTKSSDFFGWGQALFNLWCLGFVYDELSTLRTVGSKLYFIILWSACDFCTIIFLLIFWVLQLSALFFDNSKLIKRSYDILAAAGITLLPRVFSIFELSETFSRTVISVRKMIMDLVYCWTTIVMFSLGFGAALVHFGRGIYPPTEVIYSLFQVLFGFTPAVWQTWQGYHSTLAAAILFLYLFMAQFVVQTIVIAALTARYMETAEHSTEEYHFIKAVNTEIKIKSERSVFFFFTEPFNLLNLFMQLLASFCSPSFYLRAGRIILKLTHAHIFLVIYIYEHVSYAILTLRKKAWEEQAERIQKHIKRRHQRRSRPIRLDESEQTRFDVVEEMLSQRQAQGTQTTQGQQFHNASIGTPLLSTRSRRMSLETDSLSMIEDPTELHGLLADVRATNHHIEELLEKLVGGSHSQSFGHHQEQTTPTAPGSLI